MPSCGVLIVVRHVIATRAFQHRRVAERPAAEKAPFDLDTDEGRTAYEAEVEALDQMLAKTRDQFERGLRTGLLIHKNDTSGEPEADVYCGSIIWDTDMQTCKWWVITDLAWHAVDTDYLRMFSPFKGQVLTLSNFTNSQSPSTRESWSENTSYLD